MQKLTIEVDNDEYLKLTKGLHYGQLSAIMRKLITDLNKILDSPNPDQLPDWLYNDKPLVLNGGEVDD
jgi:hypothetical protein